jgi:hypothetical protein
MRPSAMMAAAASVAYFDTLAQIFPVLFLAVVFEIRFFELSRPDGPWFRLRIGIALARASSLLIGEGVALEVLRDHEGSKLDEAVVGLAFRDHGVAACGHSALPRGSMPWNSGDPGRQSQSESFSRF